MDIILDTNFILSCVKTKVDFLETEKFGKLILARQVISELKSMNKKGARKDREAAELALKIIEKNRNKFKLVDFGFHFVDVGIENYVKKNKNIAVATLDKELRNRLKGRSKMITLRGEKRIEET